MIITAETTLESLQKQGIKVMADVPIITLLAYLRNACLIVAKDPDAHRLGWGSNFIDGAIDIQCAMDHINEWYQSNVMKEIKNEIK